MRPSLLSSESRMTKSLSKPSIFQIRFSADSLPMERGTFKTSLGHVVLKTGEKLISQHAELVWKRGWEDELFVAYDNERLAIRKQMGLAPDLGEHRIDRHKISAALTRAILFVQPLVARGALPSPGARLANESLTLFAGTRIVIQMVAERLKTVAPDELKKIVRQPMVFPPANDGTYVQHYCKALYHNKNRGVDSLMFAQIFFLLESFHLASLGVRCLPVCATDKERELAEQ